MEASLQLCGDDPRAVATGVAAERDPEVVVALGEDADHRDEAVEEAGGLRLREHELRHAIGGGIGEHAPARITGRVLHEAHVKAVVCRRRPVLEAEGDDGDAGGIYLDGGDEDYYYEDDEEEEEQEEVQPEDEDIDEILFDRGGNPPAASPPAAGPPVAEWDSADEDALAEATAIL